MRSLAKSILPLTLLAACTDLTPVANFAKSGAEIAGGTDVFDGYVAAEANAVRLAVPPSDRPSPTDLQLRQAAEVRYAKAAGLAAGDAAGLKVLSLYLTVLGNLASGTLIDVKDAAGSIGTPGAVPGAGTAPAGSLLQFLVSAPLDAWRNREVGDLIRGANPDVMVLCTDLATAARAVAEAWKADGLAAKAYYARIPGPANDIRGSVLMAALANQEAAGFALNQQKATALATALDKVCSGQKILYDNVDRLDLATVSALLAGYQAEIQSASKLVFK
ncbi:hypothetical protein GCM10011611_35200 [Aliidongia dinghuensis]|uniref:Lipoprotein n=1 Tax=Aliidongia dinghuensis TaxID=1867774 RepID=A0A8J2YV13_9PROT|nr:hypothetical protein [Aliidongia dinghuensis]GGF26110.1 hypothetical protein GCM10011611_35200 [Aliidongia dinghuensis]